MKRSIQIALLLFIVTGCGTPLQQPWTNFNAYFNTFYNAEQYYKDGLDLNERQAVEINPQTPISVYLSPTQAGLEEFENAIEMGATILRDYDDSKYVEPAISLIGKSFFYRAEFFSALEKFQELQVLATGSTEQEAVFWQGRTYLEMEAYNEGIQFLENEIEVIEEWNPNILAKTRVLLAQLHIEREEWGIGVELFEMAIQDLEKEEIRSRSYFLYGQVLERLDEYERARTAYGNVSSNHLSYDLIFNAQRKEAEVSRRLGEYDRAFEIYSDMERSDKNVDARVDLIYEVARTIQLQGNTEQAYDLYVEVLQNRIQQPTPITRAKTYYGLAEIYRSERENYEMAAAYYDSAASQNVDQTELPEYFNARELASSFGNYARVKNEITEMDSLLTLGKMEPSEFDSAIVEIQVMQQEDLERAQNRREQQNNRAVNVDVAEQAAAEVSESNENGFLNIENRTLLTDASLQFQAIWGDRPLVDNWRRANAVSGSRLRSFATEGDNIVVEEPQTAPQQTADIQLDLSAIPFTKNEQERMQIRKENRQYQLANIFFLSLNMPDSAKVYYQKITENELNPQLIPRALYSLAEIELLENNREKAKEWGERLIDEYPNTIFARRVAEHLNIEFDEPDGDTLVGSDIYIPSADSTENSAEKAMVLHERAKNESVEERRPLMLFEVAKLYVSAATAQQDDSLNTVNQWFAEKDAWEKQSRDFMVQQDSALSVLSDTTLTDADRTYWESIADSTLNEPDFDSLYPFEGAYWDSARSVLSEIETSYSSSSVIPKVRILQESLQKPELDDEIVEEPNQEQRVITEHEGDAMACSDIDFSLEIEGGLSQFLGLIEYPEWSEGSGMRGEILYLLTISPAGDVTDFEQASRIDRSGIPQAFEQAIESSLRFEPLQRNENVQCVF
ncbi:MAG: hypothetical protein WD381_07440, partial [Balneolaceae bacterium]